MKLTKYIFFALLSLTTGSAWAFSTDIYAENSKLASGNWVKVSVESSGLYSISPAQLRQWGFSDPSAVRIYGYGGSQISDLLTIDNFIDDLPLVQYATAADGSIIFYASGTESWQISNKGVWVNQPNIYSTLGYYFLSDSGEEPRPIDAQSLATKPANPATTYQARLHYELDRTSPGESGYLLLGESFRTQSTRKFTFDNAPLGPVVMEVGIVSNSSFESKATFSVNGKSLPSDPSDKISTISSSQYVHGTYNVAYHTFDNDADKLEVGITVANAASMKNCWLDYIALNIETPIALPADGALCFWSTAYAQLDLAAAAEATVWDVTNPLNISAVNTIAEGSTLSWTNDFSGDRTYAAFAPGAKLPSPTFVEKIANQDLHASDCVDMVIITLPQFKAQAERIANMHRNASPGPLSVLVVEDQKVYNEFASGSPDVSAFRKFLKMLYDRGNDLAPSDSLAAPRVKYALLFGRATYDNRRLTSQFDLTTAPGTLPYWLGGSRTQQLSDNTGYGSDDFLAMLADGSGANKGIDDITIAVGRIPAQTVDQAKTIVDKLIQYSTKSKPGTWKNHFLFLADDGNNGEHVIQSEAMIKQLMTLGETSNLVSKVYVDSYDIIGGSCEQGRTDMYRMLDEGVMWWQFIGHANNHSWTQENMLNYNDINNLYLQKLPILMAATCDFMRWDSGTISGGEILYGERYGGIIAGISATRPVYISENGLFTQAMGRVFNHRNADGSMPRLGDVYRMAKNDIQDSKGNHVSTTNRLRYVLMGDPAMKLAMPDNIVLVDSIGSQSLLDDEQIALMALQRTTISGGVFSPQGQLLDDFDGTVELVIYDAEFSNYTKGLRTENVKIIFEEHGDKLFAGSAPVVGGRFSVNVAMPGSIANNFRPATMNLYAYSTNAEAVGMNKNFYVYGLDESAPIDSVAPVIEELYLNHPSFESGDAVNESPMLIARVSDDVGINLSSAGVGQQMHILLDGNISHSDVSLFFTPSADGTPSGTINYPLEDLANGHHTLRLRVWDTSGNAANQEIEFNVREGLTPTIYDIYADCNPASVETNFYISHNRPDGEVTVEVQVFSLMGRKVWSHEVTGRSDLFLSAPVTWDLTDTGGRRVPRGIYVYRASITADGLTFDTASRKLAVTAE